MVFVAGAPAPAAAQFGTLFGEPPPRPPGGLPGDRPPDPLRPPQGTLPPPGPVQTQPLPPPPGAAQRPPQGAPPPQQGALPPPPNIRPLPPGAPPSAGGLPGAQPSQPLPPGQRPPRGSPQAPQPGDDVLVNPPSQKVVNPGALFSGLDKITGRIISFDAVINETVQFGALQVTPRACYTRPPTETANTDAFLEVDEITLQGEVRRIFTGWMFAASPGLNAVEHPIYDVWLVDCKKEPSLAGAPTPEKERVNPPPAQSPTPRSR